MGWWDCEVGAVGAGELGRVKSSDVGGGVGGRLDSSERGDEQREEPYEYIKTVETDELTEGVGECMSG